MEDFKNVVHVASIYATSAKRKFPVFITIDYKDGRLSITGVEGPRQSGNCYGSCGQCRNIEDWVARQCDVVKLKAIWDEWHLNDMKAGTPKQESILQGFNGDYENRCAFLKDKNLLVDDGYTYGTAWKRVEVPADVLQWLKDLKGGAAEMPAAWAH